MGYWKSKVLPKIKKVFDINAGSAKKAGAAEANKAFDDSKEGIAKEFEEKKDELQPKVLEVYEASSTEVKTVVKERKDAGLKKNAAAVQKFLDELTKIDFPGSKQVSEASTKFGPVLVSGPVFFVFEKVSTFIVTEEVKEEGATTSTADEVALESKEKEVVVEEEEKKDEEVKKEEVVEEVEKKSEEPAEPASSSEAAPKAAEEEAAPKAP